MPTATITAKGQITIPIEVRKSLKLKTGDKLDFLETETGRFAIFPKTRSIMDMRGIFQKRGLSSLEKAPTIQEMDQDILDAASADYLRSVAKDAGAGKS